MQGLGLESGKSIRICVRDATRMGTQLLSDVLRRDRRFEVVEVIGGAESFASANVEVAILFCDPVQAADQLELIRQLRVLRPELRVVALMDDPAPSAVLQAFRAGVRGIFCRSDSYKALPKCVIRVHNGHVWASQAQLGVLVEAIGQPFPVNLVDANGAALLSPREKDVVQWVAEGLTNREIADRMELSEHTVKNYIFRIFDKLGVSSRSELVLYTLTQISRPNGKCAEKTAEAGDGGLIPHGACDMVEFCPLVQFQLGQEQRDRGAALEDYEAAYLCFSLAEAVSAVVRERSAAVLRDLEKLIPASRLLELKNQIDQHLEKAVAIDEPRRGDATHRVA